MADELIVRADNTRTAAGAIEDAIAAAMEEVGLAAEGFAKRRCPVDTGNLRNSIAHVADGDTAYVGTDVEYAAYVELGTTRTRAQPYLRPAATEHGETYRGIIRDHLEGA